MQMLQLALRRSVPVLAVYSDCWHFSVRKIQLSTCERKLKLLNFCNFIFIRNFAFFMLSQKKKCIGVQLYLQLTSCHTCLLQIKYLLAFVSNDLHTSNLFFWHFYVLDFFFLLFFIFPLETKSKGLIPSWNNFWISHRHITACFVGVATLDAHLVR